MIVTKWLDALGPYTTGVSRGWCQAAEETAGNLQEVSCPQCAQKTWRLQVSVEPVMARTHWRVTAECSCRAKAIDVFNANELGWDYPLAATEILKCECDNNTFEVALKFEPNEDATEAADMSWFWLWARCTSCRREVLITDWELD